MFIVTSDITGESFLVDTSTAEEAIKLVESSISAETYLKLYESFRNCYQKYNDIIDKYPDTGTKMAIPTFEEFMSGNLFDAERLEFNNGVINLTSLVI